MKDTYTLVSYKRSGQYGGCMKGCCSPMHYDGDFRLHTFDTIDDLFSKTIEINSKLAEEWKNQGNSGNPHGYWEFYAFLNGRYAEGFTFDKGNDCCEWVFEKYTDGEDQRLFDERLVEARDTIRNKLAEYASKTNN